MQAQSKTNHMIIRNTIAKVYIPNNALTEGLFGLLVFFFNSAASEFAFMGQK